MKFIVFYSYNYHFYVYFLFEKKKHSIDLSVVFRCIHSLQADNTQFRTICLSNNVQPHSICHSITTNKLKKVNLITYFGIVSTSNYHHGHGISLSSKLSYTDMIFILLHKVLYNGTIQTM